MFVKYLLSILCSNQFSILIILIRLYINAVLIQIFKILFRYIFTMIFQNIKFFNWSAFYINLLFDFSVNLIVPIVVEEILLSISAEVFVSCSQFLSDLFPICSVRMR